MAALFRLQNSAIKAVLRPILQQTRVISTSKKNRDSATVAAATDSASSIPAKTSENWMSYGFDFYDETTDKQITHSVFFFAITVCIIFGGFVWSYLPDYQMRDWAQREAYLELRRREKNGLPLVDPNVVNPSCFCLPKDDDLGDTEIII